MRDLNLAEVAELIADWELCSTEYADCILESVNRANSYSTIRCEIVYRAEIEGFELNYRTLKQFTESVLRLRGIGTIDSIRLGERILDRLEGEGLPRSFEPLTHDQLIAYIAEHTEPTEELAATLKREGSFTLLVACDLSETIKHCTGKLPEDLPNEVLTYYLRKSGSLTTDDNFRLLRTV